MNKIILPLLLSVFLLSACGGEEAPTEPEKKASTKKKPSKKDEKAKTGKDALAAAEAASNARRAEADLLRQQQGILLIGDSLSSGEGLSSDQTWAGLLDKRMTRAHIATPIVNASMSGNDAAGGVSRIGWQLSKYNPKLVILALGSRDFSRETDVAAVQKDLSTVIKTAKANGADVLLIGATAPASAQADYQTQVQLMYRALAAQENVLLVPDLMAPLNRILAVDPSFSTNLDSHKQIQPAIVDHVWPTLQMALKQADLPSALPAAEGEEKPSPGKAKPPAKKPVAKDAEEAVSE